MESSIAVWQSVGDDFTWHTISDSVQYRIVSEVTKSMILIAYELASVKLVQNRINTNKNIHQTLTVTRDQSSS